VLFTRFVCALLYDDQASDYLKATRYSNYFKDHKSHVIKSLVATWTGLEQHLISAHYRNSFIFLVSDRDLSYNSA
jgi:hypothetical protein